MDNKYVGHTSIINLIHAHYQLRKTLNESDARFVINQVADFLKISDIPKSLAKDALKNLIVKDFEDAVQYELAII